MSSAGIRILVMYARQLKSIQGRLFVVNPSNMVRKVLELRGLESLFLHAPPIQRPRPLPTDWRRISCCRSPGRPRRLSNSMPRPCLRVHWPGSPRSWLAGSATGTPVYGGDSLPARWASVSAPWATEIRTGNSDWGEFLAASGAAVCQPADGANKPDYMLRKGGADAVHEGGLRYVRLRRFPAFAAVRQRPAASEALPFSTVVKACLDASGGDPSAW